MGCKHPHLLILYVDYHQCHGPVKYPKVLSPEKFLLLSLRLTAAKPGHASDIGPRMTPQSSGVSAGGGRLNDAR